MTNLNVLQNITPLSCPHCDKLIFASYQFSMPIVNNIFTEADVKAAKDSVFKQIKENATLSETEKIKVEEWLAKPETLLGPQDVETVVENIIKTSHDIAAELKAE